MMQTMRRCGSRQAADLGFTLIEMMIAVAIAAVLTMVAVVAYSSHIKSSRLVEAQEMVGRIQLRQEAYFGANGQYCSAPQHPILNGKMDAKAWNPGSGSGWAQLGLLTVDKGATFFSYTTVAGLPGNPLDAIGTALNLDAAAHNYYVLGQADMSEDGSPFTTVIGTSNRTQTIIRDEGE